MTQQFFGAGSSFLKKNIFRYGLGEWAHQISGVNRFSFGQGWDTNIRLNIRKRTPPASCGLEQHN